MPPPKLVAPDHLTGIAAARWHKNHVSLSGGAVTNVACTGIRMKQRKRLQRIRGNNAVEEQRDRAALAVLERSTGTLIKAEAGWRAPINVPAVCMIDDLNLKKTSSPTDIQKALVWLEKYNGLVYVLLLFTLDNFTPACLPPLLRVLQAKNIFSLNLGEAGKRLQQADYRQLLTHLKSPAGAKLVTIYLCDASCPQQVRKAARELVGKERRVETEQKARQLLRGGQAELARARVPWRDPTVWKALERAARDESRRWGHATWAPKRSWPELA